MSRTKLLFYNLALYLALLGIEIFTVLSSKIDRFVNGKVLSSLIDHSLGIIYLDIICYGSTVLAIYFVCALVNYRIIIHLADRWRPAFGGDGEKLLLIIFVAHNALFIFAILLFNQLLYPLSDHSIWGFRPVISAFAAGLLFYGFGFVWILLWVASAGKQRIRVGVVVFFLLGLILSYNHLPHLRTEYLPRSSVSLPEGTPIIILGIDSLRADLLIPFGAKDQSLPNIEQFLAQATVFKNAHTPLARTFPSWFSILSGNYPVNSGARYNLIKRKYLHLPTPLLGNALKEQGYTTMFAIDETRFCNLQFEDGFDTLISPPPGIVDFILGNLHDFTLVNLFFNNRFGHFLFPFAKHNRAISHLYDPTSFVDDILLHLDELSGETRKIFAAIHLCAAHWPYKISGSSAEPVSLEKAGSAPSPSVYLEALTVADNQLGRIIDGLKRRNLYEQALVVLLSDHGESFGAADSWGHGTSLFDNAQNHVLIAIKPPFTVTGQERSELASTVDIAPTILDLLTIPHDPHLYDGWPLLSRSPPPFQGERKIFMETGFHLFHQTGKGFTMDEMIRDGHLFYEASPQNGLITVRDIYHEQILAQKQLGVVADNWRLIVQKIPQKGWDQVLVNLADPLEQRRNLISVYPEKALELKAAAEKHFQIQLTD